MNGIAFDGLAFAFAIFVAIWVFLGMVVWNHWHAYDEVDCPDEIEPPSHVKVVPGIWDWSEGE